MRGVLLAVAIVLPLLAGCAQPATPHLSPRELIGFRASYQTTQETANGTLKGVLHLGLDGPFQVADRDLSVHQALRLEATWDLQLQPKSGNLLEGNVTDLQPISRIYYLDGAWRIVRVEYPDIQGGNGLLRYAAWDMQGAPAPLGLGRSFAREPLPTFYVQGRTVEATVERSDGWETLAGFDMLPIDALLAIGERLRYREAGDLLPERFELPDPREGTIRYGTLDGVWKLDPLPAVEPWPLQPYADHAIGQEDWRVLHGESEDVFGMGATLDDLLDEFVRQVPEGQKLLDEGCMTQATLYPNGGSRGMVGVNVPPVSVAVLAYGAMGFALDFLDGGQTTSYRILYRTSDGVEPAKVEVEQGSYPVFTTYCLQHGHLAPKTLLEAMREGWQLPIPETGVPCGAIHMPALVQRADGYHVFGSSDMLLMHFTDDNRASDAVMSLGWLHWDEEGGLWDGMVLHERDMARIDAGGADPRPLPAAQPLDRFQPTVHCVAPNPGELPVDLD